MAKSPQHLKPKSPIRTYQKVFGPSPTLNRAKPLFLDFGEVNNGHFENFFIHKSTLGAEVQGKNVMQKTGALVSSFPFCTIATLGGTEKRNLPKTT